MKKRVVGKTTVMVYVDVELDDEYLARIKEEDDIDTESAFLDEAFDTCDFLQEFVGNGGNDKIIGTTEQNVSLEAEPEIEYYLVEEIEDE